MASRATCGVTRPPAPTCAAAASKTVSARRASPSVSAAIRASASGSRVSSRLPTPRSRSVSARWSRVSMSLAVSGWSTNTRVRERRAPITSKLGFSVVAPMRVIVPSSAGGSRLSCCALLSRWISSMKRMVCWPPLSSRARASARISRIRGTPSVTALNGTKTRSVELATRWASVVFPDPGGPQKIIDPGVPRSIASRRGLPGPRR
jgi:hypothetical protein